MPSLLERVDKQLAHFRSADRWLVAYSGGIDSQVLLHLLKSYPDHPPIEVVHINHQLQAQSGQWQAFCQQQAEQLHLPLHCHRVEIDKNSGESLEDLARQARYQVFESLLKSNDVLMLGHHQDDQVETLLLRMLRLQPTTT